MLFAFFVRYTFCQATLSRPIDYDNVLFECLDVHHNKNK